jgi:hypothetical protein
MNAISSLNQYISIIGLATLVTAFGIFFRLSMLSRNAAKDEIAAIILKHEADIKEREAVIADLSRELKWAEKFTSEELVKKFDSYEKLIKLGVFEANNPSKERENQNSSKVREEPFNNIESDFQKYSITLLHSDILLSRLKGITNLAGLRTTSSISELVDCLVDDNFHIRQAAIRAILYASSNSGEDIVSRLLDVIERASHDAAHDIAEALKFLGNNNDTDRIRHFSAACSDKVISSFLLNTVEYLSN